MALIIFIHAHMFENLPMAIRCGVDNHGAILWAHSVSIMGYPSFFQIWESDYRVVVFKPDGSYYYGSGAYIVRGGC